MKKVLIAVRPFSFVASFLPVAAGALLTQDLSLSRFILSLAAAILLHAGVNTTNDYFDYKSGVDTEDSMGSSGLLVSGKAKPSEILLISIMCYVLATLLGIVLIKMAGTGVLWFGLVGLILGYSYTGYPLYLKYRGLGMFIVFLLMGPLMVLGSYYVQTTAFSMDAFMLSIPVGIATDLILLANEIRDIEHDRRSGIKTLPMMIGETKAVFLYGIMVAAIYLFITLLYFENILNSFVFTSLVALPIYMRVLNLLKDKALGRKNEREVMNVDKMSAFAEIVLTVSLIFGLL
ncbi:MAG: 1,4-dihydroxy-2-naphthoate polyprenyltransferase [Thermotogota bacterium]|nr:1,4-dihydroxy-2-naphthoate polyprenyltransferase [Thermotogota bacterium]MDK2864788.1 1,4-dihydroxy-2-naphthoate polyprenyltransferase [Thermotogota bacterium]HCZ06292.1 1,4-dihydroxy-2-naphthoate octaprenyltransferase [Thermotogota bacterium]